MSNGINSDPYVSDDEKTGSTSVRDRLFSNPTRYIPTSASATRLRDRPTSTTQTQTQSVKYTGDRPADFKQPEYDEGEIKKIAGDIAAPRVRQLRQAVQQALVKHYENPNVRKMMVRSALQGYGIGLGSVTAQARQSARGQYAQKYSFDMQAATANFNAAWQEYMGARTTTSTGTTDYGYYGPSEITTGYGGYNFSGVPRRRPNVVAGSVGAGIRGSYGG